MSHKVDYPTLFMRTGHLGVWSGKRVKVFTRQGEDFIAKFKERKGGRLYFFDHEEIPVVKVRTITIFKGRLIDPYL